MNKDKENAGFTIEVLIYREDGGFVAHSPCIEIASEGDTVEEAQSNFVEALELWLETASREEIEARMPPQISEERPIFRTNVRIPYQHGRTAHAVGC